MKTALFLILIIIMFADPNLTKAQVQSRTIAVTAHVDEQIGFVRDNNIVIISTNSKSGLLFVGDNYKYQSDHPTDRQLTNWNRTFVLSANF